MQTNLMKRALPAVLAASLLILAACATAPDVHIDFDRSADFTKYKTFAFASPLGTDRGGYQTIVSQHLKLATQRELELRGLQLVSSAPQLLVNFNADLNEKLRITTMPTLGWGMGRGYYGYRVGMYAAWPMYYDQTTATPYKESTLNIDVVDAARNQLVWESVVTSSVSQKDRDNVQAAIESTVAAAFLKYPIPGPAKPR